MSRKSKKLLTVPIVGKAWQVKFLTDADYIKKIGPDSRAICDCEDKVLYFNLSFLNDVTIRHEVTHAFASETSFTVLQLNEDQWEEWACELFGKYGPDMLALSEFIAAHAATIKTKGPASTQGSKARTR
jgi:hypothetical protein